MDYRVYEAKGWLDVKNNNNSTNLDKIVEIVNTECYGLLNGYSIRIVCRNDYYFGCDPEKHDNTITISSKWLRNYNQNVNNRRYKNSLILAFGHELTHFDLYSLFEKKFENYAGYYSEVDKIANSFDLKCPKKNIKIANWLKEIYCDLMGAKKVGLLTPDLANKLEKYTIRSYVDTSDYPSTHNRVRFISRGLFDKELINYVISVIYRKQTVPSDCVCKIFEIFSK